MESKSVKDAANHHSFSRRSTPGRFAIAGLVLLWALAACEAPESAIPVQQEGGGPEVQSIREGDLLKISFPGSPNLDSTQQVRRDGRITLDIVGDVLAAGMTPTALEKDLAQRFSSQLVSKEVTVAIVSSSFPVFVTGAVLRPGKLIADHPITVLEAVMEAGGFDNIKANKESVTVIRQESGGTKNYKFNLKSVLEGRSEAPFFLKPSDIVYVPEKFSWF